MKQKKKKNESSERRVRAVIWQIRAVVNSSFLELYLNQRKIISFQIMSF